MSVEIKGFDQPLAISAGALTKQLYVSSTQGKPVIVMHELPGMTQSFIDYCSELSTLGFKVYMPLLFKSPYTEMKTPEMAMFCISGEFRSLFAVGAREGDRTIVKLLDEIIDHVSKSHPDQPIGVIGMCLTGGFSVAGIAKEKVGAAICCQPSYPFVFDVKSVGLSDQRREEIAKRLNTLPVPCAKSYRYEGDKLSRPRHIKGIASLLGSHFTSFPDLEGDDHSTVTGENPNEDVKKDIVEFLRARL